jgi:DNA-directed RNA polymerase subunit RPC12/RpoP
MEISGFLHGQALPYEEKRKAFRCAECKGEWMIRHRVTIMADYQVLMGQDLPEFNPGVAFMVYECLACGHYNEPPITYTGESVLGKLYAQMVKVVVDANKRRAAKPCTCPTK